MVGLAIDTPKHEHKVYFDYTIPKPRFLSLLSCLLFSGPVPLGHYNIDSLADYITETVFKGKKTFKISRFGF